VVICAALAWFDEPVEFLDRCVRSLAPLCDRLVAVDGRWELYPGDEWASPPEQAEAIAEAAAAAGLEVDLQRHLGWASQVSKRDYVMERAARGADWILVVDGDEELESITALTAIRIRAELAATELDVAQTMTVPLNKPWPYSAMPVHERPVRKLYRAGTRVPGPAHNAYALDGRWLLGDTTHVALEPALNLSADVRIRHDNQNRSAERNLAAKRYRRARQEARIEAWA
jgi:hypothetical protein